MPIWGKKSPDPPDWARPLTAEKYALFVATVGSALDAMGASDQGQAIDEGVLRLRNSDGHVESFGLQNLAQMLAMETPAKWPEIVAEHFDTMLTVDKPPQDPVEILASLRVRMWHPDYVKELSEAVHKILAPGLVLALVIDLPKKVMSVKRDDLKVWGLTEDLAWNAGRENSKKESFELVPQARPDGTELFFLIGDNLYVTSHALWLHECVEIDRENGALVGVPTRHLLVVLPIRNVRVVQAVAGMCAATKATFDEGPGSISSDLYWWREGTFTLFPIDASSQPIKVKPPDEFVEVLNRLAAAERPRN